MAAEANKVERLFLIDAPGFVFRAYHALPPLSTSKGVPTGAVHGFTNMLLKLVEEQQPECLAAVFDKGPSFRTEMFAEYKAHRPPAPEDLSLQFPLVRRVLEALRIPVIESQGNEADDVIATLTRSARAHGMDVTIVSSDKDLMQLVDDHVVLLDTMKDKLYGPEQVRERYGVDPSQLGDWLALTGDASDNVPGVPGIGAKTATKLLTATGQLQALFEAPVEVVGKRFHELLARHREQAELSRRLVALRDDIALPVELGDLRRVDPDHAAARAVFDELEMGRLGRRMAAAEQPEPQPTYTLVLDEQQLAQVVAQLRAAPRIAVAALTKAGHPVRAELLGVALAWGPGAACYVPVGHAYLGAPRQLPSQTVAEALAPLLGDVDLPKVVHDGKGVTLALARAGMPLRGIRVDTMLASYVFDPSRSSHALDALALEYLGQHLVGGARSAAALRGSSGSAGPAVEEALQSTAQAADLTLRIAEKQASLLEAEPELARLLDEIELPLAEILARMERRGCGLDTKVLTALSGELGREVDQIEQSIQQQAGWPINVGSPKQLRKLLFEQLGLTTGRRTKTGFSTDADVLADLALEHPIAAQIEEYRTLSKLKSTYLDALPALVDPTTGRIHTTYNQAVAATGRLSSSEPNLQNIPIRGDLGRKIREAFVAPPGMRLLSADYSQIELRVLAHLSADPVLLDAFGAQQDVHSRTAAEVFGVAPDRVTPEQRRVAKAVNFGVVYGQTDWGLARQLRIPKNVARRYIEGYFARYAGVQAFMERVVEEARHSGFVRTMFGRRRSVPDISAGRPNVRGAAERIARNTPIQGTAADILKLAMIRVEQILSEQQLGASMILTVHDELVFEVDEREVDAVCEVVQQTMSSVVKLDVPLEVQVGVGESWAQAH